MESRMWLYPLHSSLLKWPESIRFKPWSMRLVYKGPRIGASSEAWQAKSSFEFSVTDTQHKETPSGLAPLIVPDGWWGNNPRIIAEYYTFTRKPVQEFSGKDDCFSG